MARTVERLVVEFYDEQVATGQAAKALCSPFGLQAVGRTIWKEFVENKVLRDAIIAKIKEGKRG